MNKMQTDPDYEFALCAGTLKVLKSCPKAGQGVHFWLMKAAVALNGYVPEEVAAFLMEKYSANCGRPVPDIEIWQAIEGARQYCANKNAKHGSTGKSSNDHTPPPKWPARNQELIDGIVRQGPTLAELEERSPVRWTDGKPHAEEIVGRLYPPGSLICVGRSAKHFRTGYVGRWQRLYLLRQMSFIVPSPMSARQGRKKDGLGFSEHSLDNTGERKYLVIEFDPCKWKNLPVDQQERFATEQSYLESKLNEQAALHWHLGTLAPLVLDVHSGGKSMHAWYVCRGQSEENLLRFMRYAVSLGADPAHWLKSQFARVPDGLRDNGKRQRVIFFNPDVLEEGR